MTQITRMKSHANENTASSAAAVGYAKKLAMQGKGPAQIGIMVRAAGYRLTDADATAIWRARQDHDAAFRKALEVS